MSRLIPLIVVLSCVLPVRAEAITPGPIAVVNLGEVFRHYPPIERGRAALKRSRDELQARIDQLKTTGQRIKERLDLISPRNPKFAAEYVQLQEELAVIPTRISTIATNGEQDLADRYTAMMIEANAAILALLKTFGDEQGIRLVLPTPDPVIKARTPAQVDLVISLQAVLYAHPTIDVTKSFLVFLTSRLPAGEPPVQTMPLPAAVPPAKQP